jgi:hypothetical protein
VLPTDNTLAAAAGQVAGAPLSPAAATNVTPASLGGQQVRHVVRLRLDQQDVGPRRHGMRPLDVQRRFDRPIRVGRRRAVAQIDDLEIGVGQTVAGIENLQIAGDVGIARGVDDRDGLAAAVGRQVAAEIGELVESVSLPKLRGSDEPLRDAACRRLARARLDRVQLDCRGGDNIGQRSDGKKIARFQPLHGADPQPPAAAVLRLGGIASRLPSEHQTLLWPTTDHWLFPRVGWVERSEPHHALFSGILVGLARHLRCRRSTHPTISDN